MMPRLPKPKHHGLDGCDVDRPRADSDEKAVADVDEGDALAKDSEFGEAEAGDEQRGADERREPDVSLDKAAEDRRADTEEEDAEREGELHLGLGYEVVVGGETLHDAVGKQREGVNLPDAKRQENRRNHRSEESVHTFRL